MASLSLLGWEVLCFFSGSLRKAVLDFFRAIATLTLSPFNPSRSGGQKICHDLPVAHGFIGAPCFAFPKLFPLFSKTPHR